MSYLSRIWLNPLRSGAQRLIRNPQAAHAAVLGGISAQPLNERVLWRLDQDSPHRSSLLVLSRSKPSWDHIVEQAGWTGAETPQAMTKSYEPVLERVVEGAAFRFKLRASPTYATKKIAKPSESQRRQLAKPRPRGVRLPHRTEEHQLAWFMERAVPRWGFAIVSTERHEPMLAITERSRVTFRKGDRLSQQVTLHTAVYEGVLRITDPALAQVSLLQGVGTARGYGCGLISLAPPPPGAG
ncbi:type I-E CRISPR-associated protein Cas6/Cse3/CasE [Nocardia colli]|uniref:Type I-E CRISPR-associated protein Cas6/Cse3/CasE n=1 Tax=Nocardia colli TaxID=2545717 RepID=A0A5N0DXM9_9NOCA|nr:type I-E CRISPR-associated protein Cas6/Cse3/CasE [Nocardia colli]KAA8881882.1 type I-E CRISPR-associated protein Cas6/Cse3/CasE [Nocardia colli]